MDIKVESFIQIIQSVGFPIVVAGWLLWRTDRRLDEMLKILHELSVSFRNKEDS